MKSFALSALALLAVVGCHATRHPTPPSQLTSHADPTAATFELQRAAHASPTGVLIIAGTIVRRCPTLKVMRTHPPKMDDDSAWLAILQNLADCMDKGSLKSERILVTGGEQTGPLVRYLLAKMGVDRNRVDVAMGEVEDDCAAIDDCEYFLVRVDLAPRTTMQTSL
jgi:hypothetical protein